MTSTEATSLSGAGLIEATTTTELAVVAQQQLLKEH
jgi:hypothetical protein